MNDADGGLGEDGSAVDGSVVARAVAAQGWLAHLEAGGVREWRDFAASTPASLLPGATAGTAGAAALPGTTQLELARRVNLLAPDHPHPVVGRILRAGAPGRGRQEFPLRGAGESSRFGPRPVDPSEVPVGELVRLGAGVLAEDLAGSWSTGTGTGGTPSGARRRTIRIPGLGSRRITVTAAPLDALLYDEWAARGRRGRVRPWGEWVARLAAEDQLPHSVDVSAQARAWVAAGRRHRVELEVVAALPGAISPEAVALVRRVATGLAVLVPEEGRAELSRDVLAPWLDRQAGPRLSVPVECRTWLRERATRMADEVSAAGYAVRGDLGALGRLDEAGATMPQSEQVLAMVVRVLRNGWETQ